MKKCLALLLLLSGVLIGSAQYVELDTDTMPARRNWIGFNFTTAISFLTHSIPVAPHTGIWYKRQLTISKNFRMSANYFHYDPQDDFSGDAGTFIVGDSATTYVTDRDLWNVDFQAGLEWFKPDRAVSPVYGIELLAGYELEHESRRENYSIRDTTICPTCFLPDPERPAQNFIQETGYAFVGFALSVGIQMKVNPRNAFYLHFSPGFAVVFPVAENIRDESGFFLPPVTGIRAAIRPLEFHYFFNF